ncbi:MAG: leucyl/phenylalanyl-tRNA--protein transferase [Gammaproteobacteria bacterium]|jgi:leucyl/phenylalanyl-tRNA---protein transferase|nr:leucyl/phenylalanyl-tRNA--protein transferase [Gammaproteobacteria bacterium]MBT5204162.1 leucyl/phenylalanyl-tRNA--protein transferase [Gammaproteobacteria bacterium]MBT5601369.1 leucyl/phenylalanyl-tRNA--protein transferase [Gammaproteobacteria bacterium]MBT6246245.1 leucyl/phenylalanyl-tRNA--protein transferase [Gammaproteobacteria bacterium]
MTAVQILSSEIDAFADINQALENPDGLLAIGGDLSMERLLTAYRHGIFPWYEQGQPIMWWSPSTRAVVYPGHYRPNRSLSKVLRQNRFELAWNEDFLGVVEHCQAPRANQEGTWITEEMKAAYHKLYHLGHAHSLACYEHGRLVGGLYGVSVGGTFCGESMFSLVSDASKVAFAFLIRCADEIGATLVDCQIPNNHLQSLGSRSIPRDIFKQQLDQATQHDIPWSSLTGELAGW